MAEPVCPPATWPVGMACAPVRLRISINFISCGEMGMALIYPAAELGLRSRLAIVFVQSIADSAQRCGPAFIPDGLHSPGQRFQDVAGVFAVQIFEISLERKGKRGDLEILYSEDSATS